VVEGGGGFPLVLCEVCIFFDGFRFVGGEGGFWARGLGLSKEEFVHDVTVGDDVVNGFGWFVRVRISPCVVTSVVDDVDAVEDLVEVRVFC
jgi:hypothetical protein